MAQAGQDLDLEEVEARIWKTVAFATRYGNGASLTEVLWLDWCSLNGYVTALAQILEEEQEASKA